MCVGEEAGGWRAADGGLFRRDEDAGCSATMLASLSQENVTCWMCDARGELHCIAGIACQAGGHAWVSGSSWCSVRQMAAIR